MAVGGKPSFRRLVPVLNVLDGLPEGSSLTSGGAVLWSSGQSEEVVLNGRTQEVDFGDHLHTVARSCLLPSF